MNYIVEFAPQSPSRSLVDEANPEHVAAALAKILNKDLEFYWGVRATVTPER